MKDKSNPKDRAQKRREKLVEKDDDRKFDNKNDRGYTTDQLISLKNIEITMKRTSVEEKRVSTEQKEIVIVGLSTEDSMLSQQILLAERIAERRCPEYDASNRFWIKFNKLVEDQEKLIMKIREVNEEFEKEIKQGNEKKNKMFSTITLNDSNHLESDEKMKKQQRKMMYWKILVMILYRIWTMIYQTVIKNRNILSMILFTKQLKNLIRSLMMKSWWI